MLKWSRAYPLSPQETKALKEYLKENLEKGYIRKLESPISAPMFFVPKRNGSLWPVEDYQKLNAATIENSYPLPLISKLQDKITRFKTFAKIDLRWGFNNIQIREGDNYKAAFITNLGLYEPTIMTFSLCNAPATIQTMMDDLMYKLSQTGKIVHYIDNIIIGGETELDLWTTTIWVLRKLKENDLFANLDKFKYNVLEVDILGTLVSQGQIHISPEKVTAILNWPVPKRVSKVQQFRGLANYYQRFVKNFEKICKPLDRLTGKVEWSWGTQEQESFDTLKAAFTTAPVCQGFTLLTLSQRTYECKFSQSIPTLVYWGGYTVLLAYKHLLLLLILGTSTCMVSHHYVFTYILILSGFTPYLAKGRVEGEQWTWLGQGK
jgi:hypothetical protein